MRKYVTIILIFLTTISFAQFQRRQRMIDQSGPRGIYFESIVIPADSGAVCYIPFRIAYNQFVFTKVGNKYKAKFSVNIEAVDSVSQKIFRDIINKELIVDDYESTVNPYLFSQGLLKLNVPPGNYKITPLIYDYYASKEHFAKTFNVQINGIPGIHNPLLFLYGKTDCGDSSLILSNYQGQIPFSEEKYNLIIPVGDTSISRIDVEILKSDSVIFKKEIDESFVNSLNFKECNNNILIHTDNNKNSTRNFYLRNFNENLNEGRISIRISANGEVQDTFQYFVQWINKPFSLVNIDYAVKILKYIVNEEEVKNLQRISDEDKYKALFDFWKKLDPTPETGYNELMNEYYERVDYSMKNYSIIGSKEGAETDRGRIYIQYGKPNDIHRIYNDSRNIKEIWTYSNPVRQFVFVDKTGLGNFILNENL